MLVNLNMSASECNELLSNYEQRIEDCINLYIKRDIDEGKKLYRQLKSQIKEEHKFLSKEVNRKSSNNIVSSYYKWAIHEGMCEMRANVNSNDVSRVISELTSSQFYFRYYQISKVKGKINND